MGIALPQVTTDSRRFRDKLRRSVLEKACAKFEIQVKPGAPATETRALLDAHGISDQQLMEVIEHRVEQVQDENGQTQVNVVPVSKPHESAREQANGRHIEYEKIIAERAAENEQQEAVIEDQADVIKALMERMQSIEENQLPLDKMTPPQLKHIAKRRGIDIAGLRTKKELLAVLEG